MNMTDAEAKKQLLAIGKLLGLKTSEPIEGNSARFTLNECQEIWVKLYGYRGKGNAMIAPSASIRRGAKSPYFNTEKSQISIGFSEGKTPEAIAKDIKRRLLMAPEIAEMHTYTKAQIDDNNTTLNKTEALQNELKAIGFEILDSGQAYMNRKGLYMTIDLSGGYINIDRFSPSSEVGMEIVKAIVAAHAKLEE